MANYYLDLPLRSVGTLTAPGLASTANQALEIAELEAINANTTSMKIKKNGAIIEVSKDSSVPTNTVPVPVEIVGASGVEQQFNIEGNAIVNITDVGANPSSLKIGDGSGNYAGVTANNELKAHDADLLTAINLQAKLTDAQPVIGPVTDAQLRATPLPVLTGGLTDTELRATPVNVDTGLDFSALNQELTQLAIQANTDNLDVALSMVATEATLLAQSAKLPASLGSKPSVGSLSVTLASDQVSLPVSQSGKSKVGQLFNDYTVTQVTTASYVQLTASTASVTNTVEVFDSSGQALILAVGAASSEVDQFYIFPGGNGKIDLAIPATSRISIKAKTATANVGFIAINLYS